MDRDPETLEMIPEIGGELVRLPLHRTNDSDSSRSCNSSCRTKCILKVVVLAAIGGLTLTSIMSSYTVFLVTSDSAADESSQFTSAYVRWGKASCANVGPTFGSDDGPTLNAEGYAAVNFNSDGTITGGEVLCMQNDPAQGEKLTVESGPVKLMVAPVNLMNLGENNSQQNQAGLLQCAICKINSPYTVTLFGRGNCSSHKDLGRLYSGYVVGFPGTSSICVDNDSKTSKSVTMYPAGKLTPAEQENLQKSVPCAVCYGKLRD